MFGILLSRVVLECVNRGLGSVNSVCSSLRVFFFLWSLLEPWCLESWCLV